MSEELRGFSSYTILIDSKVVYDPQYPERNEAATSGLRYIMNGLQYGKLRDFVYNRATKESYEEQWTSEHIQEVKLTWTMEIGQKYNRYHIHANLVIYHTGLENFGLDYKKLRKWIRDVLHDYLQEFYPGGKVPKSYIDFHLNRTDSTALLELYLDKPPNNVEVESSHGTQDATPNDFA